MCFPGTVQEFKVTLSQEHGYASQPLGTGRCRPRHQNTPGRVRIPFLAGGDLGSSHTTACLSDVRGGLRADQWQLLLSQRTGGRFTTRYK